MKYGFGVTLPDPTISPILLISDGTESTAPGASIVTYWYVIGSARTTPVALNNPTVSSDINSSGQIVGALSDSSRQQHAFLDTGRAFTYVDFPGARSTFAFGINDAGQVAGVYEDDS